MFPASPNPTLASDHNMPVMDPDGDSFLGTDFSRALAAVLMIVGSVWFLIMLVASVQALQGIYGWYPQLSAQSYFIYDELFAVFTFLGLLFGFLSAGFILSNKNSTAVLITAILCVISGACLSILSLTAPLATLSKSILYYILPSFMIPLAGTLLFLYYTRTC